MSMLTQLNYATFLFMLLFWRLSYGVRGWYVMTNLETERSISWGFLDVSAVKNLPAMQETKKTPIWPLGWEDPQEEQMATHSCILA